MATKSKKATGRKSAGKIRDLTARKDPKGGAQKKETLVITDGSTRGGTPARPGKRNLA